MYTKLMLWSDGVTSNHTMPLNRYPPPLLLSSSLTQYPFSASISSQSSQNCTCIAWSETKQSTIIV